MRRLQALLPGAQVVSSAEAGLPPLQVEAAAFAWLARKARAARKTGPAKHNGRQRRPCVGMAI